MPGVGGEEDGGEEEEFFHRLITSAMRLLHFKEGGDLAGVFTLVQRLFNPGFLRQPVLSDFPLYFLKNFRPNTMVIVRCKQ